MASVDNDISRKLLNFVGGSHVKSLNELLKSDANVPTIVPVWFDSVLEGVDLWFSDDHSRVQPKY
jgi:hypothetical protein